MTKEYYLIYFGEEEHKSWLFELPSSGLEEGTKLQAEVIDAWEMTITPVEGVFEMEAKDGRTSVSKGNRSISLPSSLSERREWDTDLHG